MCLAIPVAVVLVALLAALSLLRFLTPHSPNAELVAESLAMLDDRPCARSEQTEKPRPEAGARDSVASAS